MDSRIEIDDIEIRYDVQNEPICKTCESLHVNKQCTGKTLVPVRRSIPKFADERAKCNRARRLFYLFREKPDMKMSQFVTKLEFIYNKLQTDENVEGTFITQLITNDDWI